MADDIGPECTLFGCCCSVASTRWLRGRGVGRDVVGMIRYVRSQTASASA